MADGGYTILHRKDERGVIVESGVFGPDDDIPEGFEAAEYQPIHGVREDEHEPAAESVLTTWESPIAKGGWVAERNEEAEVDDGTPREAREDLTGAEEEVDEALSGDGDDDPSADVAEVDDGTPREAREQSGEDLTGAEEEVDELLSDDDEDDQPPPKGGAGSGLPEWKAYADRHGVQYDPEDGRDEVIAALDKANIPTSPTS